MRTADALARGTAPEVRIAVAPYEAACVFIHGVRALHIAQIGHRQQRRHVGIVHQLLPAEAVDLEGIDLTVFGVFRNGVFPERRRHFVGQRRTLVCKLLFVVYSRQNFGGFA